MSLATALFCPSSSIDDHLRTPIRSAHAIGNLRDKDCPVDATSCGAMVRSNSASSVKCKSLLILRA